MPAQAGSGYPLHGAKRIVQDPRDAHVFVYAHDDKLFFNEDGFEPSSSYLPKHTDTEHPIEYVVLTSGYVVYVEVGQFWIFFKMEGS